MEIWRWKHRSHIGVGLLREKQQNESRPWKMPNATHMETLYVRCARGISMRVWQPAQPGRNGPGDGKRGGERGQGQGRRRQAMTSWVESRTMPTMSRALPAITQSGGRRMATANGDCDWR
ncbi:hypothetical protein GX48_03387 [Paracoccidioides brasiliensis]|nr:hypothetical protein GX48_03387 [Paracoccidioides brasiliensis]